MLGRVPAFVAATLLAISLPALAVVESPAAGTSAVSPGQSDARLPEIDVEGHRLAVKRRILHFVEQITRPDFLDVSLARWLKPVCPQVIGLPHDAGEYLLARISNVAQDAGVPTAKDSGCTANLFIAFTVDPPAFLKAIEKKYPHVFQRDRKDGWPIVVNTFLKRKVPVRVWYNTVPVRGAGAEILNATLPTSDGHNLTSNVDWNAASPRLQYPSVQGFEYVIVTVDITMTQGMSLATVGDYAAMIGLMELQPDATADAAPSILTVFNGSPDRPARLTAWDTSFLWGLYNTDQRDHVQRDLIVDRMMHKVLP